MSEKYQIDIEDENEENQSDEQTQSLNQNPEPQAVSETETVQKGDELADKLETAEKQAQDHYDRLLRVSAEFDNYKKRTSREMQEVVKFANEKLIREILTVVDNLERAVGAVAEEEHTDDPLLQGIHLTLNEVMKILERHHVQPIEAMGEPFDPTYHQAMMQEETDEHPPNTVTREMQKGYLIHDRLLRPAMVAVSKAKSTTPENGGKDKKINS